MSIHPQAGVSPNFSIRDFFVATGERDGVTFDGQFVQICESLCTGLAQDEVRNILITYNLIGLYGSEIPKTALFKLSTTLDGPMISSPFEDQPYMKNGIACFDLVPKNGVSIRH